MMSLLSLLPLSLSLLAPQSLNTPPETTGCHVFIDDQFIWTLEVIDSADGRKIPVLNIITLGRGNWELRPPRIHLVDNKGQEATVRKFSIDTGAEPYVTEYLKVLGNSFIGMDLQGDFDGLGDLSKVLIDLGTDRFELRAVECLEFNAIAEKINGINFDSPNIFEDFEVLKIEFMGKKIPAPAEY